MKEGARLLREWRKREKLTQIDLAARIGVRNEAVCRWEAGDDVPGTAQTLQRIVELTSGWVPLSSWCREEQAKEAAT